MSGAALELHCTRLVSEHGLAFKVLSYDAFQDIIQPLIRAMPASEKVTISENSIPPKITALAEKARERLRVEMTGKMVSLMVDGCSKNQRHFIGIKTQYCREEQVFVRTLSVEEIFSSSCGDDLKNIIHGTLRRYRISSNNLVSFTSDSGANYVRAGRLLAVVEDDDLEAENEDEDELLPEERDKMIRGLESADLSTDDFKMQSIRCAAHTLHLAIDEALKAERSLKTTIDKVRSLANYLRNEHQARQIKTTCACNKLLSFSAAPNNILSFSPAPNNILSFFVPS
ncbi:UDP-N-acetylglucosamine diphosphorylase 2 [Frankliniella fusca]|uniref:UDP-N-acetylglucosamine diphosphorylase 2 n=1 Tax=Frankliniella fusca TaxID=407009 RepID=A0AAE1HI61_9NEOP|nr:UDP-N-acetylglucosamine diphosphorylase 2 [Frankliniella fusca]